MYGRESLAEGEIHYYYYMHGNIVLKRIVRLKKGEIFTMWVTCKSIVSAFAKLRKAIVSFVISSVLPSVRIPQLGFHWADLYEI